MTMTQSNLENEMSPRQRFATEFGISTLEVANLIQLVDRFADEETHGHNGDPHPAMAKRYDKEANSKAWETSSNNTALELLTLTKSLGFDGLDFNSGLFPTLIKGDNRGIILPE
jgi:hypothetical protein